MLTTYLNQASKYKRLSREEENDLILKAQGGDIQARNKVIEHSLLFVVFVAKKVYVGNIPLEDLVATGNIGLFDAIDKYRIEGYRFWTYAYYRILSRITKYIHSFKSTIRIPKWITELEQKLKNYPKMRDKIPEATLKTIRLANMEITSIDLWSDEEGDYSGTLGKVEPNRDRIEVNLLLDKLGERDRSIILDKLDGWSLKEIAERNRTYPAAEYFARNKLMAYVKEENDINSIAGI